MLGAERVADLQFFLMDAARRYVAASGAAAGADDLLASAAALDYALLLSSQRADEILDDALPVAAGVRDTMARGARAALDVIAGMVRAPDDAFDDFARRHVRAGGIFEVLMELRESGVIVADDVVFRALTLGSDVAERIARA